ncbi:surface-adhesin E family protein [Longimicrobium sp.]|uniref:surface-adhesin E family protein n=1 Tax=Longimicrobium sp. TaxID=2029185 RepID=UPI002E355E0A|nr:surface-adhesin E family protein [Longimicrobium sp.]HEX6038581.1 surface-adhesin E family protein [Longimicrobium sp.]
MRFVRRLILCLLLVLASRPLVGQGLGIEGVPWGSSPDAVTRAMQAAGVPPYEDGTAEPGDLVFGDETNTTTALFANGRLVGISTILALRPGTLDTVYAGLLGDFTRRYGDPDDEGLDYADWWDGETGFALSSGTDDHGEYVSMLYMGPGYTAEYRRRQLAAGRLYPGIDARWTVISQDVEFRVAYDRNTVTSTGDLRRAWIRADYADPAESPVPHDQSVSQVEVDCAQRRLRFLSAIYRMGEDVVDRKAPGESGDWIAAEPETTAETAVTAICAADRR